MPNRPKILDDIIQEARLYTSTNKRLLAIFDLDSTLFDVSPRINQILHEFADDPAMQVRFPDETRLMKKLTPHPDAYGIRLSLERAGISDPTAEFKKTVIDFWRKYFFASPHLVYDKPYPGSVEFVADLHGAGADIAYLTGRDVPRMLEGTIKSLKNCGFPINDQLLVYSPPATPEKLYSSRIEGPTGHLYLKPHDAMDDTIFKKEFFERVDATPGPVWFFENEPANIQLVLQHCPHVQIVYVETVHSNTAPPPGAHVPKIRGFEE